MRARLDRCYLPVFRSRILAESHEHTLWKTPAHMLAILKAWNAYSYGLNNPMLYSDPDGLKVRICGTDGQCTDSKTDLSDEEFDRQFAASFCC